VGINEKIINKFKDCKINYYERYIMKVWRWIVALEQLPLQVILFSPVSVHCLVQNSG
jgi:hypothetical protein